MSLENEENNREETMNHEFEETTSDMENGNDMRGEQIEISKESTETENLKDDTGNDSKKAPIEESKPLIKKPNFIKRHYGPAVLCGALILSCVGGFGGAYLAFNINGNSGKTVFYQGVDTNSSKTVKTSSSGMSDIAAKTMDSVVEIQTETKQTNSMLSQAIIKGAGSGVILSKDGYIVTNNHVISGANKITVRTRDSKSYKAQLIGKDSQSDLAILKIDATELNPAILGDSSKLEVGDTAIAIGNPLGELGGTVTSGIISALDRDITIEGENMKLLQTNAAINSGNSGGGLFNAKSELIGIVNAKTSGSGIEGLGFAIPINDAKEVINELMKHGYVANRPSLGVTLVDIEDEMSAFRAGVDEAGTYISSIIEKSAAEEAGLKIRDKVLSIDGKDINSASDAVSIIHTHKAGDKITIVVERNGKKISVKATLKEADQEDASDQQNQKSAPNDKG